MSEQPQENNALALANEVINSQANQWIGGLRIAAANSKPVLQRVCAAGDWVVNGKENLGQKIRVLIGLWRFAARRFKNMDTLEAQSFSMSGANHYDPATNNWIMPDGRTPDFEDIRLKKVPDSKEIKNTTGFDFLLYHYDSDQWVSYFLASTALTMTNLFSVLQGNKGRVAILETYLHEGKTYSWFLPKITLEAQGETIIPEGAEEWIEKFLNPGITWAPQLPSGSVERPR